MSDDYYRFPGDKYRGREFSWPNKFSSALPFVRSLSVSLSFFFHPSVLHASELNKRNHPVSSSNAADLREATSRGQTENSQRNLNDSLYCVVLSHDFTSCTKIGDAYVYKRHLQKTHLNSFSQKVICAKNFYNIAKWIKFLTRSIFIMSILR